jgi:hypothetical protein
MCGCARARACVCACVHDVFVCEFVCVRAGLRCKASMPQHRPRDRLDAAALHLRHAEPERPRLVPHAPRPAGVAVGAEDRQLVRRLGRVAMRLFAQQPPDFEGLAARIAQVDAHHDAFAACGMHHAHPLREAAPGTGLSGTGITGNRLSGTGLSGTGLSGMQHSHPLREAAPGTGLSGTGLSGTGLSGTGLSGMQHAHPLREGRTLRRPSRVAAGSRSGRSARRAGRAACASAAP